ncbi:MAG TPA: DUF4127 family protein [Negativicutes bacterium]
MKAKKWYLSVIFFGLFLVSIPLAQAKTILFVPADDRPVSLEYIADTGKAAQLTILVPPAELLASRGLSGESDELWGWVMDNCRQADAMVIAADSVIYGGLVDSRTHHFEPSVINERLNRFRQLKKANPNAGVYVFSTIMRTPKASAGDVEPPYYEKYGRNIFQLTALKDKADMTGLTNAEEKLVKLETAIIPPEYLADWMQRREKNFKINSELIEMTKAGLFNYLILGRDDTSPYSQSHHEGRALSLLAAKLPASKFQTFPGADQLGMVLLAKAYNDLTMQLPIVKVEYALGTGASTIPSYEDQAVGKTIIDHIQAAGGIVLPNPKKPDLIIAVNTPVDGVTEEADSLSNIAASTNATAQFVDRIQSELAAGSKVAIADIAFGNGSDNSLMKELSERHLLDKLSAYSGWNTASNTIGYAISQGMMAASMGEPDRKQLLAVRYLDDWAYQANIRKQLREEIIYPRNGSLQYLDELRPLLTSEAAKRERLFAQKNLWLSPETVNVSFPWNRMFEIRIAIEP